VPAEDRAAASRLWKVKRGAYLLNLGRTPYLEAWDLQRALAAAVSQGAIPDTVILLEHTPVITLGRRTDEGAELHLPEGAEVEVVETDRGGKSTFHGPGQLVCYPILDLNRHGRDVKRYVRDLEEAAIRTLAAHELAATRIDGLTGVWLESPPRKICSIGVHIARWVTTHGYALNVDLDPTPFTDWITACGLEDAAFTTSLRPRLRTWPVTCPCSPTPNRNPPRISHPRWPTACSTGKARLAGDKNWPNRTVIRSLSLRTTAMAFSIPTN
jgi:lipoyl(octanoyl) transferase